MGRPPPSTKLIGLIEVSFFLMRYFRSMSRAEQLTEPDQDFLTAVSATRPELLAHCYRMLGSVEEAEDVVQETFLRAWRALDGFEQRLEIPWLEPLPNALIWSDAPADPEAALSVGRA